MSEKLKLSIITSGLSEEALRILIIAEDNTFAPFGSGGYRIDEKIECEFVLTESECAPARSFLVRITDGSIWTPPSLASFFCNMLVAQEIEFSCKTQTFENKRAAREEFEKFKASKQ